MGCILIAGCSTPQQAAFRPRVPDWEAEDVAAPVHNAPVQPTETQELTVKPSSNLLPKSPVARVEVPHEKWVPLNRWTRENGLSAPVRSVDPVGVSKFAIRSTNGTFSITSGSRISHWQSTELRLGFAPTLVDGQPYVHRLDLVKTIQPLLSRTASVPVTPADHAPTIVIDPGHGGINAGTRSIASHYYEKDYTLDWARRLQSILIERGWNALLTRSNDFDLALSNRVTFADQHRADLFVSLHFNSSFPDHGQSGLETYCLTPMGMPSTVTRGFSDEMTQAFPNNAFDSQNLLLATSVHEALLPVSGNRDRGIRRARFLGVLRNQHCPAVLIEGGYLSNLEEAKQIDSAPFRQKLAMAVANAIAGKPVAGSARVGDASRSEIARE